MNFSGAYGLPTVITTNASPRELREQLGERIADRVRAMCRTCAITAKSHRRPGEPGQPEELEGQDFDRPICIPEPEEKEKSIVERMQE